MPNKRPSYSIRWPIWGVLIVCFFLAVIHRTAAGTVKAELTAAFGLDGTEFGLMASMYFYAYMLMQIPVGLLADGYGARKTVAIGMLLGGAATLLFGVTTSPALLFVSRFFVGIGMSASFVCVLKMQSQWFPSSQFAVMSGLTTFFGNLGGAAGQLPVALLALYIGWRETFAAIAAITLLAAVVCYLFVRDSPEDVGLPPLNAPSSAKKTDVILGLKTVFRERRMIAVTLFYVCNQVGFLGFIGSWLVPWLCEAYGMPAAQAARYGLYSVFGIMFGSVLCGWISDRIKRRKPVMIVGAFIATLIWGILTFWNAGKPPEEFLGALLAVQGLALGCFSISMAVVKEINPIEITGTAISVQNMVGFLSIAVTTTVLGAIVDMGAALEPTARFQNALLLCFVLSALSFLFSLISCETYGKNVNAGK